MTRYKEDGFHEMSGQKLGDITLGKVLSEMLMNGADASELRMTLPNGSGVLLEINIKEIFDENGNVLD